MAHYLVEAANEMIGTMSKTLEPGSQELTQVLVVGCKTLQLLNKDDGFRSDLLRAARVEKEQSTLRDSIIADLNHFSIGFLQVEQKVLLASGVSKVAASYLVKRALELRTASHGKFGRLDPREVEEALRKLASVACHVATQLDAASKEKKAWDRPYKQALGVTLGVGGAVVIFVDVSATAATVGMTAAGVAVSSVVGGALVTKGVEQLES